MTSFIGISGKKQTGKDTAADLIGTVLREQGFTFKRYSFADPLKEVAHIVFGVEKHLLWGTNDQKQTLTDVSWAGLPSEVRERYGNPEGKMTVRELLQVLGTDIFRQMVDENVWAKAPFRKYWSPDVDFVIISDVRFKSELSHLKDQNAIIMRLNRETGFNDSHLSETDLDDEVFDYEFDNNGNIGELNSFVRSCLAAEGVIE